MSLSRNRNQGQTLPLVLVCALFLVIIGVSFIYIAMYMGGSRELANAIDAGNLNVAKQALVTPSLSAAQYSVSSALGPNGQLNLSTINQVWGHALAIAVNADSMAQEGSLNSPVGNIIDPSYNSALKASNALATALKDPNTLQSAFLTAANNNPLRMLGLAAKITINPNSKTSYYTTAYLDAGNPSNFLVSSLGPLPDDINIPKADITNGYIDGYKSFTLSTTDPTLKKYPFFFIPLRVGAKPHLVSALTFTTYENAGQLGWTNPIPNTFSVVASTTAPNGGTYQAYAQTEPSVSSNASPPSLFPQGFIRITNAAGINGPGVCNATGLSAAEYAANLVVVARNGGNCTPPPPPTTSASYSGPNPCMGQSAPGPSLISFNVNGNTGTLYINQNVLAAAGIHLSDIEGNPTGIIMNSLAGNGLFPKQGTGNLAGWSYSANGGGSIQYSPPPPPPTPAPTGNSQNPLANLIDGQYQPNTTYGVGQQNLGLGSNYSTAPQPQAQPTVPSELSMSGGTMAESLVAEALQDNQQALDFVALMLANPNGAWAEPDSRSPCHANGDQFFYCDVSEELNSNGSPNGFCYGDYPYTPQLHGLGQNLQVSQIIAAATVNDTSQQALYNAQVNFPLGHMPPQIQSTVQAALGAPAAPAPPPAPLPPPFPMLSGPPYYSGMTVLPASRSGVTYKNQHPIKFSQAGTLSNFISATSPLGDRLLQRIQQIQPGFQQSDLSALLASSSQLPMGQSIYIYYNGKKMVARNSTTDAALIKTEAPWLNTSVQADGVSTPKTTFYLRQQSIWNTLINVKGDWSDSRQGKSDPTLSPWGKGPSGYVTISSYDKATFTPSSGANDDLGDLLLQSFYGGGTGNLNSTPDTTCLCSGSNCTISQPQ